MRFARVPSGDESCSYCLMLASRGFAYTSENSAGRASHTGCDCLVMPGFAETVVEDYDPDDCYRLLRVFDEIDARKDMVEKDKEAIKQLLLNERHSGTKAVGFEDLDVTDKQ